jgi:hypothetical protein
MTTTTTILIPPNVAGGFLLGLSTDISGGKLAAGNHPIIIGSRFYASDTAAWYMVTAGDGTLTAYKDPPVV